MDVPSEQFKGFAYRADRKIGEGGQAFGVFLARMIKIDDEEPQKLVVLKCIANSYFTKAGEVEKRRRINSLEKEIECLSKTKQDTSIILYEVIRNH